MSDYSISDVSVSGFRLIGQKPLTVAAWGLFIFLGVALPGALMAAVIGPDLMDMIHAITDAARTGGEPDMDDMWRIQTHMLMFNPLAKVLLIVGQAMITAAIFRAILEPKRSAFAYLRLGPQEFWLALVRIVATILLFLALFVAALPFVIVTAVLFAADQKAAAVGVILLGVVALIGLAFWLIARFSMAQPLSFVERRFALFESWDFTRRDWGKLLATGVLVKVIFLLLVTALYAVVGVALFGVGAAFDFDAHAVRHFFEQPVERWLTALAPVAAGCAFIGCLIASFLNTVVVAPYAAAYQALAKRHAPEPGVAGLRLEGGPEL